MYERAFGARCDICLRYSDAKAEDFSAPLSEEQRNYIYHAEITLCGQRVLASDSLDKTEAGWIPVSIVLLFDTAQEVECAYAALREGAVIRQDLIQTTYAGAFVSLIDRYGVRWELMTETS